MEQVKTFDHNQHTMLDNLINEFLKENEIEFKDDYLFDFELK